MKAFKLVGLAVVAAGAGYLVAVASGPHSAEGGSVGVYKPSPHTPGEQLELDDDTRRGLLSRARALWDGEADKLGPPTGKAADEEAPLILTVFHSDGRLLVWKRIDDPATGLAAKLAVAVKAARSDVGIGAVGDVFLHIDVVSYNGRFLNFGVKGLFKNRVFEPRITGLVFEKDGKRAELPPLETAYLNLGPKGSRKLVAQRLGVDPKAAENDLGLWIEIYRTLHFGERYPDRAFGDYLRSNEALLAKDVDDAKVLERLKLVGQWYRANVRDGEVTYKFDPTTGREIEAPRTMVRSTMSVWVLNRLGAHLNDPELLKLGEETMKFYFERYFQMAKSKAAGSIQYNPKRTQKGETSNERWTTAGFVCAAALERPDREKYLGECDLLMNFMMGKRNSQKVFDSRWALSQYFMPGQALLTLAYAWEATGDPKYAKFLEETWDVYLPPLLDMMHLGDKRYAPYAPAWFTQPAAQMWFMMREKQPEKAERYRTLVYAINDKVVTWYEANATPAAYTDQDGILGPKYGFRGNVSITAASLEALVDASRVADLSGDPARRDRYMAAARQTIAYLMRLQYTPANTYYTRHRERITGGFKTDLFNNQVWMDNVWHLTSAFIKTRKWGLLPGGVKP
jgi:hypothetical protein